MAWRSFDHKIGWSEVFRKRNPTLDACKYNVLIYTLVRHIDIIITHIKLLYYYIMDNLTVFYFNIELYYSSSVKNYPDSTFYVSFIINNSVLNTY